MKERNDNGKKSEANRESKMKPHTTSTYIHRKSTVNEPNIRWSFVYTLPNCGFGERKKRETQQHSLKFRCQFNMLVSFINNWMNKMIHFRTFNYNIRTFVHISYTVICIRSNRSIYQNRSLPLFNGHRWMIQVKPNKMLFINAIANGR